MFNKPTTNRNAPVTRREVSNILGSSSRPAIAETPSPAPVMEEVKEETANPTPNCQVAHLIVGPGVKLKGAEILDCDTLVVEGCVEASMDSRMIRIAENGSFSGNVSIDIAEIHGSFEGELTARSQLIIHATGKVHGKIRYGKLLIDEGGVLCGDINTLAGEKPTAFHLREEPVKTLAAIAG